jgi:hypothetical protein
MNQNKTAHDPQPMKPSPMPYPSYSRYYLGAIATGIGVGISWTLLMTTSSIMQRYITKPHAIMFLYGMVVYLFITQWWMLVRWNKRMKRDRAEMEIRAQEMMATWTKPTDS